MGEFSLTLRPARVLFFLVCCIGVLALLNAITLVSEYKYGYDHAKGLVPMFRLNAERNIPTFFSTCLLLTTSALCFTVGKGLTGTDAFLARYWHALSVIALYLAADEASHIHEMLDDNKELWTAGLFSPTGVLDGPWVVVYGILVIAFCAIFARFFFRLGWKYKFIFGLAGGIFVSGAIGLEMIGAAEYSAYGDTLLHEVINSTEEVMEMTGVSLAIFGLLTYMRDRLLWSRVRFDGG